MSVDEKDLNSLPSYSDNQYIVVVEFKQGTYIRHKGDRPKKQFPFVLPQSRDAYTSAGDTITFLFNGKDYRIIFWATA